MALAVIDALKAVGPDREKLRDYITGQQKARDIPADASPELKV